MVPRLPCSIAVLLVTVAVAPTRGQTMRVVPEPPHAPLRLASAGAGQLLGIVRDEDGAVITGVSVLVSGATSSAAVTDSRGRFALNLPVGAYVVRAARSGYVSSPREIVRVASAHRLEHSITLVRAADIDAPDDVREDTDDPAGRSEIAWRLRHLKRTVLRDVTAVAVADDEPAVQPVLTASTVTLTRAASTFFANTDFTGQVNLLATSAFSRAASGPIGGMFENAPDGHSAGVANLTIGAPVGEAGDWSVRGAVAASGMPSWTLLGEYRAREEQPHALRLGVSYSTQGVASDRPNALPAAAPESRSAGSVRVSDRWLVNRVLDVDYDVSVDRYDYLAPSTVLSPRVGARVRISGGMFVFASSARRTIAPGADQFLPSSAPGPWLPPTRTFSSLSTLSSLYSSYSPASSSGANVLDQGLNAELVRNDRVGVEYVFADRSRNVDRPSVGETASLSIGETASPSIGIEWFSQPTTNQLATLFGVDDTSETGHYYLSTVGDVNVEGWRVHARGQLLDHVAVEVSGAMADARWTGTRSAWLLRRVAPELARRGVEQIANVRTSVDVDVPRTATAVRFDYRLSFTDQADESRRFAPIGGGRFNLEVRQRLPFQPIDTGVLNVLLTLRTLLHDDPNGSMYDELLTLRPPTRLTGGLQVRF